MSSREEIRSFLTTRRARVTPEQAGVPTFGGQRRVPGLRREEVAHLAGVSTDYYSKLERGDAKGASREVLAAISRALQLDETENQHLFDLIAIAEGAGRPRRRRRLEGKSITVGTQAVLDALSVPAFVQNRCLDFVGANAPGRALFGMPHMAEGPEPLNSARFQFLDPRSRGFYRDSELARRNTVALLHQAVGQDPYDEQLIRLIGQLSTQSADFRDLWAGHDVIRYQRGAKRYHNPEVGDLDFGYESFDLTTEAGFTMLVYTVEPGSPTEDAMRLLTSWAEPARAPSDGFSV